MITPFLMLVLMSGPLLLAHLRTARSGAPVDTRAQAAIGLAALFVFTGLGHFVQTGPMAQMLPPWVPAREGLVLLTGVGEFLIALGFLVPRWRVAAGWAAAFVLVAFFPANIYAALERVPFGGHAWGPAYLLLRAPLQAAILAWVVVFVLRPARSARARASVLSR